MQNPALLSKSTLLDLKQIVEDYPYFHAVKMLYLKNLAVLEDVRLGTELKKMSVFVPDRRKLYALIEHPDVIEEMVGKVEVTEKGKVLEEDFEAKGNPIEDVPEEAEVKWKPSEQDAIGEAAAVEEVQQEESLPVEVPKKEVLPPLSVSGDYVKWLEENAEDLPTEDGSEVKLMHGDLIDSFIEKENMFRNQRFVTETSSKEKIPENKEKMPEPESLGEDSIDDSYFTETLARVYFKQKRYDKALEIIKALSLKYPEKNIYFADQIRYIEQFINIKK